MLHWDLLLEAIRRHLPPESERELIDALGKMMRQAIGAGCAIRS